MAGANRYLPEASRVGRRRDARWLATAALHTELACSVLPTPLEQHVGVEPIAQRQLRHGYFRFAGFDGLSAFESLRVIGPPRTTPRNNFTCVQNGPRYFIWRTPLSLTATLFARRPQNDTYNSNSIKPPHWLAPYAAFCSCRSGAGAGPGLQVAGWLASGRGSGRCRPLSRAPHPCAGCQTCGGN